MADHPSDAVVASPSSPASPALMRLSDWLASFVSELRKVHHGISTQDSDQDRTGLDPHSPVFRKLLAGIVYSRWLALTYYALVAGILLIFVLRNWVPRWTSWYKRRANGQRQSSHSVAHIGSNADGLKEQQRRWDALVFYDHRSNGSSSGGSSPLRTSSGVDEYTPLITNPAAHRQPPSFFARCCNSLSAWLVYQPGSLRGFRNRIMPSNGASILILAYLGINLFYLLFNIEFSVLMIFILADRAAVLFTTNLPILYVLSSKNQPLQPLIGYSYASLNIVHRRLGEWMCLLALVHGGGMFVVWATLLRPSGYDFVRFISDRVVILGLGAFVCYQGLYFTSIATVRQKAYEVFLATHISLQLGALGFLYFHHSKSRPYVTISVAVWGIDRFLYRMGAKTNTYKGAVKTLRDGETVLVSVSVPLHPPSWPRTLLGMKSIRNGWEALDHIFLSIPGMAHKHVVQAHPFSIASAAPPAHAESADLQLIIRARDGFSKDLLAYTSDHGTVNVRIDGPYGAHSASRLLRGSGARIIIAGGSGIAVTYPLLKQLLTDGDSPRDVEDATHTAAVRPILFIWVVHSKEQLQWIDLKELHTLGQRAGVDIAIPEPTNEAGRPALGDIIDTWVDLGRRSGRLGIVVSGPEGMSREVRNKCAKLQAHGMDVEVEVEKYGW